MKRRIFIKSICLGISSIFFFPKFLFSKKLIPVIKDDSNFQILIPSLPDNCVINEYTYELVYFYNDKYNSFLEFEMFCMYELELETGQQLRVKIDNDIYEGEIRKIKKVKNDLCVDYKITLFFVRKI